MSMRKHVYSKATYFLGVHQFITQQVGKGGKRRNEFSCITQNRILNIRHKTWSFRGNILPESAPGHNTVSKGDINGNKFSFITQIQP